MDKLLFTPLDSSQLRGYHYNKGTGTLTIQFMNGSYYEYFNIPGNTMDEFESSESQGKFFHSHIKGIYEFKKLSYEP